MKTNKKCIVKIFTNVGIKLPFPYVYVLSYDNYQLGDYVYETTYDKIFKIGNHVNFTVNQEKTYKIIATNNPYFECDVFRIPQKLLSFAYEKLLEGNIFQFYVDVKYKEQLYWIDSVSGEKETYWKPRTDPNNCIKIKKV